MEGINQVPSLTTLISSHLHSLLSQNQGGCFHWGLCTLQYLSLTENKHIWKHEIIACQSVELNLWKAEVISFKQITKKFWSKKENLSPVRITSHTSNKTVKKQTE